MEANRIFDLGELFEQVQLQKVFPDNKTFVDCTPKQELSAIRERYEAEKDSPHFNLADFVQEYFQEPEKIASGYKSNTSLSVKSHIENLWDVLTRKTEKTNN